MTEGSSDGGRLIDFPRPQASPHVACGSCGSEWLTALVVVDAASGRITGRAVTATCPECGQPVDLPASDDETAPGLSRAGRPVSVLPSSRPRPEIVTLCGSVRFAEAFLTAQRDLSYAGKIVLTVSGLTGEPLTEQLAAQLAVLHEHKIDLADWVLVLNVGGYIGESTRREIDYATARGKRIEYLEPAAAQ